MGIIIRREKENEYRAVENLTRESFWNVYRPGVWSIMCSIATGRIRILCRNWIWSWKRTGS